MKVYSITLTAFLTACAFCLDAGAVDPGTTGADNTAKNKRDSSGETKTPEDQSNTPEDLQLVRKIRQTLVKDESLSITAKNVKIITSGGRVTLRGPVNNPEEKEKIDKVAKDAAGSALVDNQIEVKAAK